MGSCWHNDNAPQNCSWKNTFRQPGNSRTFRWEENFPLNQTSAVPILIFYSMGFPWLNHPPFVAIERIDPDMMWFETNRSALMLVADVLPSVINHHTDGNVTVPRDIRNNTCTHSRDNTHHSGETDEANCSWLHQSHHCDTCDIMKMETLSVLLRGIHRSAVDYHHKGSVMQSIGVFFGVILNKLLNR